MNCKQGDLAIIVKAFISRNIGSIVEVTRPSIHGPSEHGFEWETRSARPMVVVAGDFEDLVLCNIADCPDAWLRPISGIPEEETIEQSEELTA